MKRVLVIGLAVALLAGGGCASMSPRGEMCLLDCQIGRGSAPDVPVAASDPAGDTWKALAMDWLRLEPLRGLLGALMGLTDSHIVIGRVEWGDCEPVAPKVSTDSVAPISPEEPE